MNITYLGTVMAVNAIRWVNAMPVTLSFNSSGGVSTLTIVVICSGANEVGVCDRSEFADSCSPQHAIDNDGQFDFIRFQFHPAVEPFGRN